MSDRITPAWAGKSVKSGNAELVHQDHPRMGGEKRPFSTYKKAPPGITPAWAGKSVSVESNKGVSWDHPRMGGEKGQQGHVLQRVIGSPPHGRGKAKKPTMNRKQRRITPAWAGKSI